jgi:hypothetical protein
MSMENTLSLSSETLETAMLSFHVVDVTNSHAAEVSVQPSLPAAAVTRSLVVQLELPDHTPFGLRDESTGAFLDDTKSIGEQITPGARLTVTTKTHLG